MPIGFARQHGLIGLAGGGERLPVAFASLEAWDQIQVVARYLGGNPNGSARDIAGIANAAGTVVGLMPHPEHAVDPLTGPSADGLGFFTSILTSLAAA